MRKLDDKSIFQAELFAKTELNDILNSKCARENLILSEADKINFFGCFTSNPSDFNFQNDELAVIKKIVRHVDQSFRCNDIIDALADVSLNEMSDSAASNWFFNEQQFDINANKTNIDMLAGITVEENCQPQQNRTHYFLNRLLATADQNACRSEGGYRYDADIKNFAVYFRMLAGPLAYNTIQKNLVCALPSLSTTNRFIQNSTKTITEGVLRSEELLNYLNDRKLPLCVALSEDATRIEGKVQYDARSNQLIGFVLPTDYDSGVPIPFAFRAGSTEEILKHFSGEKPTASCVITIMAKPMGDVPSFCLLIFGTDNKFTAQQVANRWKFITSELMKLKIMVLSIASDSDPRYNSAMRQNSTLGSPSNIFPNREWFSCGGNLNAPFYIQDTVHIGTKMRNSLLKTLKNAKKLMFGDRYFIQIDHLHQIKNRFSRDKHRLTNTALNPFDRQNFDSVLRICDSKVIELLKNHINGSDATVMYLNILKSIIDSFMDDNLSSLQRIHKIWYSVFIVRMWRKYVVETDSLNLKNNFLSSYCYVCLELNAHSLVLLMLYLREIDEPEFLKLNRLDSQQCEKFYSQLRSFTSTFSTKANCTVKEIMSPINKIQLQNYISGGGVSEFIFPKELSSNSHKKISMKISQVDIPSKDAIAETIEHSKLKAIDDAIEIGLLSEEERNIKLGCKCEAYKPKEKRKLSKNKQIFVDKEKLVHLQSVSLINYAYKFENRSVICTSPYVEIFGSKNRLIVRKTSLTWLLRANSTKLSSDRLLRVKNSHIPVLKKQKKKLIQGPNHSLCGILRVGKQKK